MRERNCGAERQVEEINKSEEKMRETVRWTKRGREERRYSEWKRGTEKRKNGR